MRLPPQRSLLTLTVGVLLAGGQGCAAAPNPITIHDSPGLLVDVAYDPHAGHGHTHPTTLSPAHISMALRGLHLRGRDVAGAFGLLGDDEKTPAFSGQEITTLAPYLSAALGKCSSRDLVRFHLVKHDERRTPLVTSGGLFVRNHHLYIILANARTSPTSVQYETPYEPDSRLNPLLPIARFKFAVEFVPKEFRVPTSEAKRADGWAGYLDESKVAVIDLLLVSR